MKLGLLSFACTVSAHTLFTTLFINGKDQGDGTCVRMPRDPYTATGPIYPITGNDMACGRDGNKPVAFTCPVPHRATLTFELRLHPDKRGQGVIDKSHKGPCAVYLKQIDSLQAENAASGPGWFKIWEDGYNNKTDRWCVDTLIEKNGFLSVKMPTGIPKGAYLARLEILALHNAVKGDPQFYAGCAQIFVEHGPEGELNIPEGKSVSIPGHVSRDDAGVKYNLYQKDLPEYQIPGPGVFIPTGQVSKRTGVSRIESAVPKDCVIKNGNWCAKPVPKISGAESCWASVKDCWAQGQTCWDTAPPSGNANCKMWEGYCKQIQESCNSGATSGPPKFSGEPKTVDLPARIPVPWNDVFDLVQVRRIRRQQSWRAL